MTSLLHYHIKTQWIACARIGESVFCNVFLYGRTYWIRTNDQRIKSPLLYQLSYAAMFGGNGWGRTTVCLRMKEVHDLFATLPMVGRIGFEPMANGLKVRCSTD